MKHYLLLLTIAVTSLNVIAQNYQPTLNTTPFRFHYRIRNTYYIFQKENGIARRVYTYTEDKGKLTCGGTSIKATKRIKANITHVKDTLFLDFWCFSKDPIEPCTTEVAPDTPANRYYINKGMISNGPIYMLIEKCKYIQIAYRAWDVGGMFMPFKLRFGKNGIPNNASTDVNAGLYIGKRYGWTRFYGNGTQRNLHITPLGFIGLTAIPLKPATSKIGVNQREVNELAVSLGGGVSYSYRDINIGLLGGWDVMTSPEGENYLWNKGIYLGFTIGYKISFIK